MWYLDSRVSAHKTNDISEILNPRPFYNLTKVSIGDAHLLPIKTIDKGFLHTGSLCYYLLSIEFLILLTISSHLLNIDVKIIVPLILMVRAFFF